MQESAELIEKIINQVDAMIIEMEDNDASETDLAVSYGLLNDLREELESLQEQ